MSGLAYVDNRILTPALRDGATTIGPLNALIMTGAGSYFTEPIDVGTVKEAIAFLYTTAHSGSSPTLDIDIQYGFLDSNNQYHWLDSGDSFVQVTTSGDGVTSIKKLTANFGKFIRFRLKIGGTSNPSYTVTFKLVAKG